MFEDELTRNILHSLLKYKSSLFDITIKVDAPKLANLSRIKPTKEQLKTTGEFIVLGSELFAVIGGLFA